jgi:hypothetical protein
LKRAGFILSFTDATFPDILPLLFTIWAPPVVMGLFAYSFVNQVSRMFYSFFNDGVQDSGINLKEGNPR